MDLLTCTLSADLLATGSPTLQKDFLDHRTWNFSYAGVKVTLRYADSRGRQ